MSGLGLICLVTSCFTNVTYSYLGLWLVVYALCLTAEHAPLLSKVTTHRRAEPQGVPCLISFPDPDVHSAPPSGEKVPVCWKPVCTQAVLKEKTL